MDTNNVITHQQGSKGFRYTEEFKADVLSFLASGHSVKKAMRTYGVKRTSIHRWLNEARRSANPPPLPRSKVKIYRPEHIKAQAASLVLDSGKTLKEAAAVMKIPQSSISHWVFVERRRRKNREKYEAKKSQYSNGATTGNSLAASIAQAIAQRDAYLACLTKIKQELELAGV